MSEITKNLLNEFGNQLGFGNIQLKSNDKLQIKLEGLGDLHIEKTNDGHLRFTLSTHHPYPSKNKYLKSLELCHYNQPTQKDFLFQSGLIGENTFFFTTILKKEDMVVSNAILILETLIKLQETLLAS